ncbi:LamG-like jellyroll fold domain-containing protein [Azospirillum sp. sgz301742]
MSRYLGTAPAVNAFSAPGAFGFNDILTQQVMEQWDAGTDPYWANTVLLFQPKFGDTTFLDRSASAKTIIPAGSPALTAFSPFVGGASMASSSAGTDYLTLADSADWDFGTGDFVYEAWVYCNTTAPTQMLMGQIGTELTMYLAYSTYSNLLPYNTYSGGTGAPNSSLGAKIYQNGWMYCVMARVGNVVRMYLNGMLVLTATDTSNINAATGFRIGHAMTAPFTGYIAAARVTKGTSRGYIGSTIPVPKRPFPIQGRSLAPLLTGTPIGNHTAQGGLAAAFDGVTSQTVLACAQTAPGVSGYGNLIGLSLASSKLITAFKAWAPNDDYFLGNNTSNGLKLEGWNGSAWVTLWTGTYPAGVASAMFIADGIDLTAGPVSQVRLNAVGNGTNSTKFAEVQFFGR